MPEQVRGKRSENDIRDAKADMSVFVRHSLPNGRGSWVLADAIGFN